MSVGRRSRGENSTLPFLSGLLLLGTPTSPSIYERERGRKRARENERERERERESGWRMYAGNDKVFFTKKN